MAGSGMMDNWYSASFRDGSAQSMWHMFWEFHDFRVVSISYYGSKDIVDLVLEYDDGILAVLLRFAGDVSMGRLRRDYEADWISGATIHEFNGQIQWTCCEAYEFKPDDTFGNVTFARENGLIWAVLDENGDRVLIPDDILYQNIEVLNMKTFSYETEHHDYMAAPAH